MSIFKKIKVVAVSLFFGCMLFSLLAQQGGSVSAQTGSCQSDTGNLLSPSACAPVPAGCPGSNLAGPPAPGTVCPSAPSIPAGCPGSTLAGPPAPGVTCPGTPSSITTTPVRCQNIQGLNEQSACILQVQKEIDQKCGSLSGAEKDKCVADVNNQASTSPLAPNFVKSDCQGNDIKAGEAVGSPNHCGILDYLTIFIKALSGIVGIVVVVMIVIGGIQYSASGGDPQGTAAAKKRIVNAILALVFYSFIFAFLQYLIPGGVL